MSTSSRPTSVAGCVTTAPFSATRRASISRSDSRREAMPTRARNLATLSFPTALALTRPDVIGWIRHTCFFEAHLALPAFVTLTAVSQTERSHTRQSRFERQVSKLSDDLPLVQVAKPRFHLDRMIQPAAQCGSELAEELRRGIREWISGARTDRDPRHAVRAGPHRGEAGQQ